MDQGALALSQYMVGNTKIVRVNMESNTVSHRYIEEMAAI